MVALFVLAVLAQVQPTAPGKMVDVGGYKVHVNCMGEGSPAVVVTGGLSVDWALVQPEVAKFTRICTYDVAGTAWSEAGPSSTCDERVTELRRIVPEPAVLVGFSVGGLVSRYFVSKYPELVRGVVFVDHAFTPKASSASPRDDSAPALIFQTPITFDAADTSDFKSLPAEAQRMHQWAAQRRPAVDHAVTADSCLAALGKEGPKLGRIPVAVVSTGNQAPGHAELQAELLALSSNSRQWKADRSFHSVEIDQPDVVVAAIRAIVEQLRR